MDPNFLGNTFKITTQPKQNFHYRYVSELNSTHGVVTGQQPQMQLQQSPPTNAEDTSPAIRLQLPAHGQFDDCGNERDFFVLCSLHSYDSKPRSLSPHLLMKKAQAKIQYNFIFDKMSENPKAPLERIWSLKDHVIVRLKTVEYQKALQGKQTHFDSLALPLKFEQLLGDVNIDDNSSVKKSGILNVCLGFTIFERDFYTNTYRLYKETIYSDNIFHGDDLKIHELCNIKGSIGGETKITILIKLQSGYDYNVRMYRYRNTSREIGWEKIIPIGNENIFSNAAITFTLPEGPSDLDADEIEVMLEVVVGQTTYKSQFVRFWYINNTEEVVRRKIPRMRNNNASLAVNDDSSRSSEATNMSNRLYNDVSQSSDAPSSTQGEGEEAPLTLATLNVSDMYAHVDPNNGLLRNNNNEINEDSSRSPETTNMCNGMYNDVSGSSDAPSSTQGEGTEALLELGNNDLQSAEQVCYDELRIALEAIDPHDMHSTFTTLSHPLPALSPLLNGIEIGYEESSSALWTINPYDMHDIDSAGRELFGELEEYISRDKVARKEERPVRIIYNVPAVKKPTNAIALRQQRIAYILEMPKDAKNIPIAGLDGLIGNTIFHEAIMDPETLLFLHRRMKTTPHRQLVVRARNSFRHNLLHHACAQNKPECIRPLVGMGCALHEQDCQGRTPLHIAIERQHNECIAKIQDLLANHSQYSQEVEGHLIRMFKVYSHRGHTVLHAAVFENLPHLVKVMLQFCKLQNVDILQYGVLGNGDSIAHIMVKRNLVDMIEVVKDYVPSYLTVQNYPGQTVFDIPDLSLQMFEVLKIH